MAYQTITFTSASSNLSSAGTNVALDQWKDGVSSNNAIGPQLLAFEADGDSASGTAVIGIAIISTPPGGTGTVVGFDTMTVASNASARQTVLANNSGNYLCTIQSFRTNKNTFDLSTTQNGGTNAVITVRLFCYSLTTFTTLSIRVYPVRAI